MNTFISPLETYAAEGVTGLIISNGAKGVAATIVKRATAILAIVTALQAIESGSTVTGLSGLTAALATSDLDPGEALAIQGFLTQLATQASLLNGILGTATIVGQIAATVIANVADGVQKACAVEIAKYGAPAA